MATPAKPAAGGGSASLTLTPPQRAYLTLVGTFAAQGASGDVSALRSAWLVLPSTCKALGLPLTVVERSILHTLTLLHIFVGAPRAIESLEAAHDARPHDFTQPQAQTAADLLWGSAQAAKLRTNFSQVPAPCGTCGDAYSTTIRRAKATATLGAIYGSAAAPLKTALTRLHPAMHAAIIYNAYGSGIADTPLTLIEIETAAVAVLSGTNTPRQLLSHLRGSLLCGLPPDFITHLIDECFEAVWQDDGVHGESKEVWRTLQRHLRAKAARASGIPIDHEAEEAMRQDATYKDAVDRSSRMAKQGQQHPLYSAGRAGAGDEGFEDEDQPPASAPHARAAQSVAAASGAPAPPSPPEAQVSDEEIESTMRVMMRNRARTAAAEVASRAAGSASRPADDRWPIPPHMLDPSGGMGGAMAGGMMMGPPGMGGPPGMLGGMGAFGSMAPSGMDAPLRARL